jgi:hypothetical protein
VEGCLVAVVFAVVVLMPVLGGNNEKLEQYKPSCGQTKAQAMYYIFTIEIKVRIYGSAKKYGKHPPAKQTKQKQTQNAE